MFEQNDSVNGGTVARLVADIERLTNERDELAATLEKVKQVSRPDIIDNRMGWENTNRKYEEIWSIVKNSQTSLAEVKMIQALESFNTGYMDCLLSKTKPKKSDAIEAVEKAEKHAQKISNGKDGE